MNMNLRAFFIHNPELDKASSDLFHKLQESLKKSKSANERRMELNSDDPSKEEDLLSYFSDPDDVSSAQFCTMLRLAPGKDAQHISNKLFNKDRFLISDLDSTELDAEAIYKNHYYFNISNSFLVTNLPGNTTILRLQTYINWLTNALYQINPVIEAKKIQQLADIKNITIIDPISNVIYPTSSENESETKKSVFDLAKYTLDSIRKMLTDAGSLTDHELSQMISAKLIIEFAKPKKADSEEMQRAYSALLKPVADLDHLSIRTRDNKTITKGTDIQRRKSVKIDLTESGRINEQTVQQQMALFLLELENEKKAAS
ncbi:hypothetical protein KVP09_04380 [Alcaligenaceae bacterium CGII-47]|nr:hypothetical protein [Alcaligenaceae bacterium CGII-47]